MKNTPKPIKIWIGIDVSKLELELHSSDNTIKVPPTLPNKLSGFKKLNKTLASHSTVVQLVFESTGGYEKALFDYCSAEGIPCSRLNPSHSRNFAKAQGLLAKTDKIDAKVLADFGAMMQPQPSTIKSQTLTELQEMIHYKRHLNQAKHREKMQLEHSKPKVIERMIKSRIASLEKQIEKVNILIEKHALADEALSRTIGVLEQTVGVAKRSAVAIFTSLPELGTVTNREIAALAGLAPFNKDSGSYRGKRSVAGGRRAAREALYMPAIVGSRFNPVLKEFYQRLKAKGKPSKVAITATMRKLLTHLNACVKRDLQPKELHTI